MRIWFKQWKNNRIVEDVVIEDDTSESRTHKIFDALDEVCHQMDIVRPIWLDSTIRDFQRSSKARFRKDTFVEEIDFDFLEMEVLEED